MALVAAGRAAVLKKTFFTEGRQGNEETGVGSHQTSKQALLLPLMAEIPTTLRDLLFKTKYPESICK
jgi:hypothetical protein